MLRSAEFHHLEIIDYAAHSRHCCADAQCRPQISVGPDQSGKPNHASVGIDLDVISVEIRVAKQSGLDPVGDGAVSHPFVARPVIRRRTGEGAKRGRKQNRCTQSTWRNMNQCLNLACSRAWHQNQVSPQETGPDRQGSSRKDSAAPAPRAPDTP